MKTPGQMSHRDGAEGAPAPIPTSMVVLLPAARGFQDGLVSTFEASTAKIAWPMRAILHIRRHPVLSLGADDVLSALANRSEVRVYDDGDRVVRANTPQREVMLIADGQVELSRRNREADTQILVGLLEAPAIFGDAELYARTDWVVSGAAVGPTTIVAMPNEAFDRMIAQDHQVAAALYRDVCARHMLVIQIMQILALQKTQLQILRLLWGLSEEDESGARVAPLSQVQLANALGLNRKTIARNLAELARDGLIEKRKSEVVLMLPDDHPVWRDLDAHGLGATWRLGE